MILYLVNMQILLLFFSSFRSFTAPHHLMHQVCRLLVTDAESFISLRKISFLFLHFQVQSFTPDSSNNVSQYLQN
jgi:hypothetical protein